MKVLDLSHGDIHDISYEELQNQFEKDIHRIRILEKALDKACEELENLSYVKGIGQVGKCYAEWKEYLLNEVKE